MRVARSRSVPEHLAGARRHPALAGRGLVAAYRYTLAPLIGLNCRHLPTCSDYADQALARFGLWAGGWMILARLCRCHPWGTSGLDFVPDALPARARWFLPWRYGRWRRTADAP
jgi:putative membrane protein insertion efficiency factor